MTGETRQIGPLQKEPSVGIPRKSIRPATLLKKTLAQVFSCEIYEISKIIFFAEHLWATASEPIHG